MGRRRLGPIPWRRLLAVLPILLLCIISADAATAFASTTGGTPWYVSLGGGDSGWNAGPDTADASTSSTVYIELTHPDLANHLDWFLTCENGSDYIHSGGTGTANTDTLGIDISVCATATTYDVEFYDSAASSATTHVSDFTGYASQAVVAISTAPPASGTSQCTSAQLSDPGVGYLADGSLQVRFDSSTSGIDHSSVVFAYSGGSDTYTLSPTADAVDGSPGYEYASFDPGTGLSGPYTATVTEYDATSTVICRTVVPVTGSTINPGGGSVGASNPDNGSDCGLNPYCYVRSALDWAFVPDAGVVQGWQAQISTIEGQPPVSIFTAGWGWLGQIMNPPSLGTTDQQLPGYSTGGTGSGASLDLLGSAANLAESGGGQVVEKVMEFGIWFLAMWWIWRRLAASFGSKESQT